MKKLTLALIGTGLLFSCNSYAVSSACTNSGYSTSICSPKYCGGFYVGLTGFYLKPSETGLGQVTDSWQYGTADSSPFIPASRLARSKPFDPDYEWEWGANIGYDIPCTANNIDLSYWHLSNKKHAVNDLSDGPISFSSIFTTDVVAPIGDVVGGITFLISNAYLEYKVDQVDLKMGHMFNDACGQFQIRPSIGLRYNNLKHELTFRSPATLEFGLPALVDAIFFGHVKSQFNGVGPLVSLDARYGMFAGFGLVGHFDSALIVGEVEANSNLGFTFTSPALPISPVTTDNRFESPDLERVVGSVSGKLGADYTFCFCNKSSLTIEAGYQVNKFYDPFDLIRGDIPYAPVIHQRITHILTNDLDVRGPYVNVTFRV